MIVFSTIFGFKIGGYFDTSILIPFSIILLIGANKDFKIPRYLFKYLFILAIILIYPILLKFIYGSGDSYIIFRSFRAFSSFFFISIWVYFIASNKLFTLEQVTEIIQNILFIGAIIIIIQIYNPNTQKLFMELTGFNKSISEQRGFGLTAGYDSAGFLCVIGYTLTIIRIGLKRLKSMLYLTIFIFSIALTSRSSMILLIIVTILFLFVSMDKGVIKTRYKLLIVTILIPFAIIYFIPLVLNTISFQENIFIPEYFQTRQNYNKYFAQTDLEKTYLRMWFLPKSFVHILWGRLNNEYFSDIGYIKIIHMVGIIQLLLIIYFYILLWMETREQNKFQSNVFKSNMIVVNALIIIMILANLKNLYYLTRGLHEVYILISVSYIIYGRYASLQANQ